MGEDFEQVVIVPASFEASGFDPGFDRFILFEQVQSDVAENGEVFGAMILAQAVMILLKGHVEYPMQAIFDAPVAAFTLQEPVGRPDRTSDILVAGVFLFPVQLALVADLEDRV